MDGNSKTRYPEKATSPDERSVLLGTPAVVLIDSRSRRTSPQRKACTLGLLILLIATTLLYLIRFTLVILVPTPTITEPKSIAIIGAGPAGIACALSLATFAKVSGLKINITIFEATDQVGGRLTLGAHVFPFDDDAQDAISPDEIAGNTILYENARVRQAAEQALERDIHFVDLPSQDVAYFDGEKFASWATRPLSQTPWSRWASQSWQYGPFVVRSARNLVKEAKAQVGKLAEGDLDSGIKAFLQKTENLDNIIKPAQVIFDAYELTPQYQNEVFDPQIRRILGLAPHGINALQLSAALAAEDITEHSTEDTLVDTLWELVVLSSANIYLRSNVTHISPTKLESGGPSWAVEYRSQDDPKAKSVQFDQVILTAPGLEKLITEVPAAENITAEQLPLYRSVYVTFFATPTLLDPEIFNSSTALPKQILFVDSPNLGPFEHVSEISLIRSLARTKVGVPEGEGYLYRLVGIDSNPTNALTRISQNDDREIPLIDWFHTIKIEHGHPILYPQISFPTFQLNENGLWQTSSIDCVGTSFDLSWMAGEAVAKKVVDQIALSKH